MSTVKKKDLLTVKITGFNKKGNGTGDVVIDEKAVAKAEVPFAIPGDIVSTQVSKYKKGKCLSLLKEIVDKSESRISPKCKHFGSCGGCRWQQMSYDRQAEYKEDYVRKCFANLLNENVTFHSLIPCIDEWQYRNKMEFSFSSDAQNNKFLGLIMDSSRGRVTNLSECHLVSPWFTTVLNAVREWWDASGLDAFHPFKNVGALRTLVLRESKSIGDRMIMLTVSGNPDYALNKSHIEKFVSTVIDAAKSSNPEAKISVFLRIQQVAKGMPTNFYEMLLYGPDHIRETLNVQLDPSAESQKFLFHVSPTAFFQPNTKQAEKLYSTALQMAGIQEDSVVYDLYCGTGTLGICAAKKAKQVIGIEVSPESALDARTNAALNNIENITILSGAVRHLLTQIVDEKKYPKPDIVLVDPPRPGLDPMAMRGLLSLDAEKIVYVSCNPETQAENLEEIIKHGYDLVSVQPIDQFAQTAHIENVAVLKKSEGNDGNVKIHDN
ncbi:MAG: 23S rRNA (uracil(1939)-C(5))-methyltransferase RlmD [Chlamydiota bacterium]|nr:23S rRNA (uracil(1939)-C(5))-methyltransferase RlmD [Chlamydiota bacterium]